MLPGGGWNAFPSHKLKLHEWEGDTGYFYILVTEGSASHGGNQETIQNLCDLGTETPCAPKKLELRVTAVSQGGGDVVSTQA